MLKDAIKKASFFVIFIKYYKIKILIKDKQNQSFKGSYKMIKIIDVDYTDICSCCDDKVKIVKIVDSIYSSIDFCENCWNEFIKKMKKENYI